MFHHAGDRRFSAITLVFGRDPSSASCCANSSMSPTTGMPDVTARATAGSRSGTPGLIAISSTPMNNSSLNAPQWISGSLRYFFASAKPGGLLRLSAARRRAPCALSQRSMDRPVSPRPSTSTDLSLSIIISVAHLNFRVARPINTSNIVMIQKRTEAFGVAITFAALT
jgi:hypothetical protein